MVNKRYLFLLSKSLGSCRLLHTHDIMTITKCEIIFYVNIVFFNNSDNLTKFNEVRLHFIQYYDHNKLKDSTYTSYIRANKL